MVDSQPVQQPQPKVSPAQPPAPVAPPPPQPQVQPPAPAQPPAPEKKKMSTGMVVLFVILGLMLCCCVSSVVSVMVLRNRASSWWVDFVDELDVPEGYKNALLEGDFDKIQDEIENIDLDAIDEQLADQLGTITGKLSYPSDYIPTDIMVCAEAIDAIGVGTCVSPIADGTVGAGNTYTMTVPPGTYHVYAHTRDLANRNAYYSEAVECGLAVSCTDHTPIDVEVEAGETITNVDPGDWYAE